MVCRMTRLTTSLALAPLFLVVKVGGPVTPTRAPPPTLTPFPEADTPVLCVPSFPLVGRRRVEAEADVDAIPSAASLIILSPSPVPFPLPFPLAVVGIVSRTRSSLPPLCPLVLVLALTLPLRAASGCRDEEATGGLMTPCNASGRSADTGGAKIDNAPVGAGVVVPDPEPAGSSGKAGEEPFCRLGDPPFALINAGLK
jgi:hypothetical protein